MNVTRMRGVKFPKFPTKTVHDTKGLSKEERSQLFLQLKQGRQELDFLQKTVYDRQFKVESYLQLLQ